jgi:hypothetical protein
MIDPELKLTQNEQAHLKTLITMEGFKVLQQIMEASIERFKVALLNCDATDERKVLELHNRTKAAAQFYTDVINRVNNELEDYAAAKNQPKVVDPNIENVLGLDEQMEENNEVYDNEQY